MSNYIFDFDGTIADTLPNIIKWFESSSFGSPISSDEIEKLKNMPALEVIRELRIPLWRLPSLLVKGRADLAKHITQIPMFPGLNEVFDTLSARGDQLFVVSSNSTANIRRFLQSHQAEQHFVRLYGNSGIFGKAKVIRDIMRKHHLSREDTLYVGDETRDIEAARRAHIPIISVAWGYNGNQLLKSHQPDFFVDKPEQLLTIRPTS